MPYLFLLRLLHLQLPLRITDPEDLQAISVLLATGLIEAEIETLHSTPRYAASRAAMVLRITEAGHAEARTMWDTRTHSNGKG
ncbi:hypothetical protein [Variovorax paradoxus]|uniref:hypothetical protein n=1 Tax=Variovorax paradoxus TaxID=34073 RepID=UPI002481673E|nr:hypothetical protein [Variovorax paradoxus]WGT62431.1 hypothetical protein QHG62_20565 [Variovorax paradoxus]